LDETEGGETQQCCFELGACSKQTTAGVAPTHNNQQQNKSFAMTNEWRAENKADRTGTSNNQPKKGEGFANLLVFLVFFS
jgi:hypothetical protein